MDSIVQPEGGSTDNVAHVHFTPGARTAWYSHAGGHTLYVTEGRGRVQSRGEAMVELRPARSTSRPTATNIGTALPTTTS